MDLGDDGVDCSIQSGGTSVSGPARADLRANLALQRRLALTADIMGQPSVLLNASTRSCLFSAVM